MHRDSERGNNDAKMGGGGSMLRGKENKPKGPEVRAGPVHLRKRLKSTVAQNNKRK